MKDNKYINILISNGSCLQLIADTDVEVGGTEGSSIHLSDLLYNAILEKTEGQDQATVTPGKYTIRLMATIVGEQDEISDFGS